MFKIAALAAALVNAWFFHAVLARRAHEWDTAAALPVAVQASGHASILLWTLLIVAGRLVAFTGN
jgi:3'-phosphoadenosine 5'-phosphosulfate (PAPS) 3'-phosphatase